MQMCLPGEAICSEKDNYAGRECAHDERVMDNNSEAAERRSVTSNCQPGR